MEMISGLMQIGFGYGIGFGFVAWIFGFAVHTLLSMLR